MNDEHDYVSERDDVFPLSTTARPNVHLLEIGHHLSASRPTKSEENQHDRTMPRRFRKTNEKAVSNVIFFFFIRRTYETCARFVGTDLQNTHPSTEWPSMLCVRTQKLNNTKMKWIYNVFVSTYLIAVPLSLDSKKKHFSIFLSLLLAVASFPLPQLQLHIYVVVLCFCVYIAFSSIHASSSCFVHFAWPSFRLSHPVAEHTYFFSPLLFTQNSTIFLCVFLYFSYIFFYGPNFSYNFYIRPNMTLQAYYLRLVE